MRLDMLGKLNAITDYSMNSYISRSFAIFCELSMILSLVIDESREAKHHKMMMMIMMMMEMMIVMMMIMMVMMMVMVMMMMMMMI